MGNRREWKWHADFELGPDDILRLMVNDKVHIEECPAAPDVYKVHVSIALEVFKT